MQPFLMMKQTLDSAFDPGPLLLYGPNVKVTDTEQILSRGKSRMDVVDEFTVGFESYGRARELAFAVVDQQLQIKTDTLSGEGDTIRLTKPLNSEAEKALRTRFKEDADRYVSIFKNAAGDPNDSDWNLSVDRNRCFLDLQFDIGDDRKRYGFRVGDQFTDEQLWIELLRGIIHVPGLRGNPERAYNKSAVGSTFPGTFETYVASIVLQWTKSDPEKLGQLSGQLKKLGLTWKLHARRLNDASIELLVGRTQRAQQGGANDLVSVADVGFGVSQTLPVLVALIVASPGQIVYLEQPEIHLHPRAQYALSEPLVEAARRGVRVVVETHSSLLIRGIQTAVANKTLRPEMIAFNWFGRNATTGFQTITVAEVDSAGRFGDWPLDFDEVSQDADWQYLDAVVEAEEEWQG